MIKQSLTLLVAAITLAQVQAGSLSQKEINQIESEFGITLSSNQIAQLSAVVYPTNSAQWRADAYGRIDANRKADLDIQVVDMNGDPVEGAQVSVKMKKNDFNFGGTFSAKAFSGVTNTDQVDTNVYKARLLSLFNAVGLNNGFKPRLTGIHPYLPGVKSWAAANDLPVRGHLLIWPGNLNNNHLTADVLADVEAVEAALTNGSSQATIDALRVDLKDTIRDEMIDWASQHDVYEWDVINEALGNRRVQDALDDYDVMADWFRIAESNMVASNCKLMINEYKLISAFSESLNSGFYTNRRDNYMTEIDRLIANDAPLHRIGFQSRRQHEVFDPQIYYDRLEEFGVKYGLEMVGTEFEVKDRDPAVENYFPYMFTEMERAEVTESVMVQYFSHPLVTGLNAWNTIHDETSALVKFNGEPNLNGLVWYYLHRIRFNTDVSLASGVAGRTGLRAFKGEYDVQVSYNGVDYASSMVLTNDESIVLQLVSSVADPVGDAAVVDAWHYDDLADGSGVSAASSAGIVGGVTFPDYALGSIQNEAIRWQSDGVTDSMYRGRNLSSYDGATNGIFELSVDFLDADFSGTALLSNGLGRVQLAFRDGSNTDAGFRLAFTANGGSNGLFRLEGTDDLNNNLQLASFSGTTLGHLSVRAIFDLDNRGSADSFNVYYRHDGGAEIEAHSGQLSADFDLGQLRYVVQTYNGGCNWAAGDRISVDNLIVRKFGDASAPVFVVDPITTSAATQDIAYASETISGTASNALSYGKVSGPAWLNIAADGTLSGTPTAADAGQNSWMVQASNGIETDTAVLKINVSGTGGSTGPGTNLSIVSGPTTKGDDPTTGDTVFSGVTVQAGDVVVIGTAPNKTTAINLLTLTWSGAEGGDGTTTTLNPGDNDGRTSYLFYTEIINPGTYTFTVESATANLTANSALFVLRADSGTIQVADTATLSANTSTPGLSYDFSPETLLSGGTIAIESFASKVNAALTLDANYIGARNSNGRHVLYSTAASGSTWSKAHTAASAGNFSGSGAVFYEETVSGGGNNPPVFGNDPVTEIRATQDMAYTGRTLADNASDADLDSLTFDKVSGPAWLSIASNGALTGTPTSTDLGINSWKVLVTDGAATNFATLEIDVIVPGTEMNVLFIAIDDMNPIIGAYGNSLIETPNMDQLAARGTTFLNAHCQWSVCGPSRASIMTGLMPEQTGVMGFTKMRGDAVDDGYDNSRGVTNIITIPQHFIDYGYTTAASGKINDYRCVGSMNPDGTINNDGGSVDDPQSWSYQFQSSGGVGGTKIPWAHDPGSNGKLAAESIDQPGSNFVDGVAATQGIELMNHLVNNQPFFLGVGFKKPHLPFLAPKSSWDLYDRDDFSPHPFPYEMENATGYALNSITELRNTYYLETNGSGQALQLIPGILPDEQQKLLLHGYYASISHVDDQVGRVLDELDALGLTSNTIVVLWGDHGFHLGDHNEWGKHTNLEQATRVPFMISVPGLPEGQTTETPVGLLDLFPTLCELAGIPEPIQPPNSVDPSPRPLAGRSLVSLLDGTVEQVQTGIVNHYGGNNYGYAYRTDRYRYIEWINSSGTILARELYDYQQDPMETINLAGEPGYEGLIYQFSVSMRDAAEAGGCDRLKSSTAPAAPVPAVLGGVELENGEISWPDAAGVTYTLMSTTNLVGGTWVTNQTGVTAPIVMPTVDDGAFFRIEIMEK